MKMLASNVKDRATLETAAQQVGVRAEVSHVSGQRYRLKLFPVVGAEQRTKSGRRKRGEAGDTAYQRTSASYHDERRVHAVCWHGFRDYFRAVFAIEPEARFRTALDTWKGSADFEARFRASGHRSVGSQVCPRYAAEVCRCGEEGLAV